MNRITTHPGDVLKEELEARGISQKKFSEVLNVPYTQLNEILNGKRPVTTDFALMMEAALGINPELLINMQSRYNMSVARQKKPLMAKLFDIRKACAATAFLISLQQTGFTLTAQYINCLRVNVNPVLLAFCCDCPYGFIQGRSWVPLGYLFKKEVPLWSAFV